MFKPAQVLTAPHIEVLGIRRWKRWQIDGFLRARCTTLHYANSVDEAFKGQARSGGVIAVWAARETTGLAERAADVGVRLWRMEDGFIRSVGLGSNHVGGASLVLDEEGIYFDPRRPSRLERLVMTAEFPAPLLARAAALRSQIVEAGLSKYNVGDARVPILGGAGRRRVLVLGQVESDASLRAGAVAVCSNLSLLQAVRCAEPSAWLIYKPHPDVEAGTRAGDVPRVEALRYADEIVSDVSPAALFDAVDTLHVMTSLGGFEALLRGLPVVTWGQPFYAGWGLTTDQAPIERRSRAVSLDMLVAAALILYPLYVHPETGTPCEVEDVVAELARRPASSAKREGSRVRRNMRLMLGALRSLWPYSAAYQKHSQINRS